MKFSYKDWLCLERSYCKLCFSEGMRGVGTPGHLGLSAILPPRTSIDKYGRSRYETKLRARVIKHFKEFHSELAGRIR